LHSAPRVGAHGFYLKQEMDSQGVRGFTAKSFSGVERPLPSEPVGAPAPEFPWTIPAPVGNLLMEIRLFGGGVRRMAEVAEELLPIGVRVRFALFGLECAFGVSFSGAECERVFREANEDQVSTKRYTLFASPRLTVTGRVDEYEPDSIWLRVVGGRGSGAVLRRVVDGSAFAEYRLQQSLAEQKQATPLDASDD